MKKAHLLIILGILFLSSCEKNFNEDSAIFYLKSPIKRLEGKWKLTRIFSAQKELTDSIFYYSPKLTLEFTGKSSGDNNDGRYFLYTNYIYPNNSNYCIFRSVNGVYKKYSVAQYSSKYILMPIINKIMADSIENNQCIYSVKTERFEIVQVTSSKLKVYNELTYLNTLIFEKK